MPKTAILSRAFGGVSIALLIGAAASLPAQTPAPAAPQGQPGIPFSGAPADADNQAVVDALKGLGLRPYHTLDPVAARRQPTFTDGVMAVLKAQGRPNRPAARHDGAGHDGQRRGG